MIGSLELCKILKGAKGDEFERNSYTRSVRILWLLVRATCTSITPVWVFSFYFSFPSLPALISARIHSGFGSLIRVKKDTPTSPLTKTYSSLLSYQQIASVLQGFRFSLPTRIAETLICYQEISVITVRTLVLPSSFCCHTA